MNACFTVSKKSQSISNRIVKTLIRCSFSILDPTNSVETHQLINCWVRATLFDTQTRLLIRKGNIIFHDISKSSWKVQRLIGGRGIFDSIIPSTYLHNSFPSWWFTTSLSLDKAGLQTFRLYFFGGEVGIDLQDLIPNGSEWLIIPNDKSPKHERIQFSCLSAGSYRVSLGCRAPFSCFPWLRGKESTTEMSMSLLDSLMLYRK